MSPTSPRLSDVDTDLDGVPDCIDQCPNDFNKVFVGACGCGVVDTDSDGDGMPDCLDMCPHSPITQLGPCGCDVTDTDGDGVLDCVDQCPSDASKSLAGLCGCNVPDTDSDGDGIPDCYDACPGQSDIANEGLAVQFSVPVTAAGGEFRLCWCAAGFSCDRVQGFVDFGSLEIDGPTLEQDRTCVAGQTCRVDELLGTGLHVSDHVTVLNTCGTHAFVEGLPEGGSLSSSFNDTFALGFGPAKITAGGGEYRLCWCGFNQDCSQPSQFRMDVGRFWLVGPSLQQSWTCINGQACQLDTIGQSLAEYDMVAVMDTCMNDLSAQPFPWTVLSMAGSSGASYEFQNPMRAGQYRICWCATGMSCSSFEDFALDIGSLSLLGPTPLQQHRTCVAGQPCHFEGFSSYGELGLGILRILDTCGSGSTGGTLGRLPNTGVFTAKEPRTAAGCGAAAQDADLDGIANYLDECPFDVNHNLTGLCGCGIDEIDSDGDGTPDCLDACPSDASKDVSPGHCGCGTSDVDTDLDGSPDCIDLCPNDASKTTPGLCGCGTSDSADSDSDGTPDCYDQCPSFPDQTPPVCGCTAATADDDGDGVSNCFDACPNDFNKVAAGVCGCGVAETDTDLDGQMDCVDACPLDAAKTSPGQCGCGVADTDTDSDSVADCMDQCPSDASKTLPGFCGCGVSDTDADNDGVPDCHDQCPGVFDRRTQEEASFYTLGDIAVSAAGGLYRLCWCATEEHCQSEQEFTTDVGTLEIIGPSDLHQDRTCLSGKVCRVAAFEGLHLDSRDQLLVLDSCMTTLEADSGDNASMPVAHFVSQFERYNGTEVSTFASHGVLEVVGGTYTLCWCSGAFDCSTSSQFHVDVGSFTVVGPISQEQHFTCVAGQACLLSEIHGHWFSEGDSVLLLETCGMPEMEASFPDLQAQLSVGSPTFPSGASTLSLAFPASTAAGGIYQLCWCPNVTGSSQAENCAFSLGLFYLLGPRPLEQDRTCVVGAQCVLGSFRGLSMANQSLLVLDTCGLETSARYKEIDHFDTTQWQPLPQKDFAAFASSDVARPSGGSYRLCWCSGLCREFSHFAVDMGELQMIGPTQAGRQHRTCISGQPCSFSVEGWRLNAADAFVILHTCGEASTLARSPASGHLTTDSVFHPDAAVAITFARTSFNAELLTSAGGIYRLCWCSAVSTCQDATQYLMDVGQVQIIGPQPLEQDRTCVAGQTCLLGALSGVTLSTADRYYILDTCGIATGPTGFPGAGISDVNVSTSESTVSWNVRVSAAGGLYRICWCAAGQSCSGAEDFQVDMGRLDLVGPHQLGTSTCFSGQTCVIPVSGTYLSSQDTAVLLDTCGISSWTPGLNSFPSEGTPVLSSQTGALGTSRLQLGSSGALAAIVTAGGGEYRICWCAGGFGGFGATASDVISFLFAWPFFLLSTFACKRWRL